jgi:hypothetical protein
MQAVIFIFVVGQARPGTSLFGWGRYLYITAFSTAPLTLTAIRSFRDVE